LLKKPSNGPVAAHEVMMGTSAIRNLIREDKVAQMYSAIQTGASAGMRTLGQFLEDLLSKGMASREETKMPDSF
jgi:twitching motility protein PilT